MTSAERDSMALSCQDVEVRIGTKTLLANASLTLAPGRVTAILGPNGAGKSTLLSVLAGQRAPTQGRVTLDGQPLDAHGMPALALRRALMPQESAVAFDFTAQEIVALGRYPHRRSPGRDEDAIIEEAMALTDVSALAPRILNTLSGGEKARAHMRGRWPSCGTHGRTAPPAGCCSTSPPPRSTWRTSIRRCACCVPGQGGAWGWWPCCTT